MMIYGRIYFVSWLALLPASGFCSSWEITQTINLDDNWTLTQENSSNSIQAGNHININGTVSNATQTVMANSNSISLTQDEGNNNVQAVNIISSPDVGNSVQSITNISSFELTQLYGNNNFQTGNLIEGSTDIAGNHTQSISTDTAIFSQTGRTLPNTQAGNAAIDVSGSISQTFVANSLTVDFTNTDPDPDETSYGENDYQAANYVKTGNNINTTTYIPPPP